MSEAVNSSLYWDERTKARAQAIAEFEGRSVSNLLCFLVDEEWRRRGNRADRPINRANILVDERAPYTVEAAE